MAKVPKCHLKLEISVAIHSCNSRATSPSMDGKVATVILSHGLGVFILLAERLMLVVAVNRDVGLGVFF